MRHLLETSRKRFTKLHCLHSVSQTIALRSQTPAAFTNGQQPPVLKAARAGLGA